MNLTATDASIAALGGHRPGSDITARPVTARKAGPVALTLTGQRRYTAGAAFLAFLGNRRPARSGGGYGLWPATALCKTSPHYRRHLGNPCVEKAGACRSRQNKGAAPLTKAPSAFRLIGGAVRQGTLTITGSNVRLGTEMPVALSSFLI